MKASHVLLGCVGIVTLFSGCIGLRKTVVMPLPEAEVEAIIVDSQVHPDSVSRKGDWQWGDGGGDWLNSTLWAPMGKGEARLSWRPVLPKSGNYRVSVWFGGDPNADHASNTPFVVHYDGGKKEHKVDQRGATDKWRELGSYPFKAGSTGYVEVNNNADGNVVADAVKFEYMK